MTNFVLLRSTVVFSFFVSGSGSDRCGSGSGWPNRRFHMPDENLAAKGILGVRASLWFLFSFRL